MPEDGCECSCTRADVLRQLGDLTGGPQHHTPPPHGAQQPESKPEPTERFCLHVFPLCLRLHEAHHGIPKLMLEPNDPAVREET